MNFDSKISKYLSNQANPEEIKELHVLIEQSDENRLEFAKAKNIWVYSQSQLQENQKPEGFDKVLNRVNPTSNKKTGFSISKYYRYAASFLLPLFIAGTAWLYYSNYIAEPEMRYAEVVAPPKTNMQITLPDQTKVWLSPESKLKYPLVYGRKQRRVFMEGEGYFEVAHNPAQPFVVDTKNVDIEVLGTSFNLEAYPNDEKIKTTLVRGSVNFVEALSNQTKTMIPGDQLTFDLSSKNITIEKVNTDIYRLVKDGMLLFKRNDLYEVCNKLERWFMVPVDYKGTYNHEMLFTAKFEGESLETILKIISQTIPIKYEIFKDHVEISDRK